MDICWDSIKIDCMPCMEWEENLNLQNFRRFGHFYVYDSVQREKHGLMQLGGIVK